MKRAVRPLALLFLWWFAAACASHPIAEKSRATSSGAAPPPPPEEKAPEEGVPLPSLASLRARLQQTQKILDYAVASGADQFASQSLAKARQSLGQAQTYFRAHRHDRLGAQQKIDSAYFDAKWLEALVAAHQRVSGPAGGALTSEGSYPPWLWALIGAGGLALFGSGMTLAWRWRPRLPSSPRQAAA